MVVSARRENEEVEVDEDKQKLSFTHLARGLVVREVGLVEGLLLDDLSFLFLFSRFFEKKEKRETER